MLVTRSSVCALVVAVVVYLVVAEVLSFHPLYPTPGTGAVRARAFEGMALWVLLWSARGWSAVHRRKIVGNHRALTVVTILPLVTAFLLALYEAQEAWREGAASRLVSVKLPAFGDRLLDLVPFALALLTVLTGAMFSVALFMQVRLWRKLTARGTCSQCGYNLTGNVSGQCPECGKMIKVDQPVS